MSIEQDTGNAEKLPLAERARRGLLAHEPALALDEVLQLEHPTDRAARKVLSMAIRAALEFGDLASTVISQPWQKTVLKAEGGWLDGNPHWDRKRPVTLSGETKTVLIDREAYQAWRAQCPASLLCEELTKIKKWLGAMPARPESILPVETSLPELSGPARLTEAQQDKADCQAIARALWAEHPGAIQSDILKNSRIKPYLKKWPGKNTLPGWLSEVDPRPKEQRRGRPKAR